MTTMPRVKQMTKKQAEKLFAALLIHHPEFLGATNQAAIAPLSKREQQLDAARTSGYMEGRHASRIEYEAAVKKKAEDYAQQRKALHLETLQAVRDLASAHGQMIGEISRAMQSEKDQL